MEFSIIPMAHSLPSGGAACPIMPEIPEIRMDFQRADRIENQRIDLGQKIAWKNFLHSRD